MSVNNLNLKHKKGTNFKRSISITNDDGTPRNITGCTFRGQVKRSALEANSICDFTFTLTDAVNGKVDVKLPATFFTDKIGVNLVCYYDIEMVLPDLSVEDVMGGYFTIMPEITT